jgi:hypothetical protein
MIETADCSPNRLAPSRGTGSFSSSPRASFSLLFGLGQTQRGFRLNYPVPFADTMVDRPETDGPIYVTGWTISGPAVLGAILALWMFGI